MQCVEEELDISQRSNIQAPQDANEKRKPIRTWADA